MKSIIKQIIISSLLLVAALRGTAQTFFAVGSGANMYIQAGASVSFDSLVLSPSADVLITPTDITKSTELMHTATGMHISRVYQFSQPVAGFSGTVDFSYKDEELNGADESTLVLNAYTNNTWASFPDGASRDADNNYVTTPGLSNISLDELTLTSISGVLPLQWISVDATRQNSLTTINWVTAQEANCKYYQVQRSTDTRNWQNVGNTVKANNGSSFNYYNLNDATFLSSIAYYRIVLADVNGKVSYSTIVSVKGAGDNKIVVYPNPAKDIINVRVSGNSVIKRLKVFDASGRLLMVKEGSNSNVYSFNVTALANGFYMMVIETNNGKLSKGFVKE